MNDVDQSPFWEVAEPFIVNGAEQSTMMGNGCLRSDGEFFASLDRRTGELIVKLPADRVEELIDGGEAKDFAPNGRRFKEWASIPTQRESAWSLLMEEALRFACTR